MTTTCKPSAVHATPPRPQQSRPGAAPVQHGGNRPDACGAGEWQILVAGLLLGALLAALWWRGVPWHGIALISGAVALLAWLINSLGKQRCHKQR